MASGPHKKNGVLIAIKNTTAFTLHNSLVDTEGRYLALDCTMDNTRCTLVNIYAPNTGQIKFLTKLMKKINQFRQGHLIICGDFNFIPDNILDASSQTTIYPSPMGSFLRNNDLYDVWRYHHTTERDYTFFFHWHNSYT